MLKLNMLNNMFFDEDTIIGSDSADTDTQEAQQEEQEQQERTFTQSEVDNIVKKRLSKYKASDELRDSIIAEYEERKRAEKDEATRLKNMSAEQREIEELKKQLEAQKELIKKNEMDKMKATVESELIEKGMPKELVDFVSLGDAETTSANLNKLVDVISLYTKQYKDKIEQLQANIKWIGTTPKVQTISKDSSSNSLFNIMSEV